MLERISLVKEDVNKLKLRADHFMKHSCTLEESRTFYEAVDFLQQDLNVLIE